MHDLRRKNKIIFGNGGKKGQWMFNVDYACVIQNIVHGDPKPYINPW